MGSTLGLPHDPLSESRPDPLSDLHDSQDVPTRGEFFLVRGNALPNVVHFFYFVYTLDLVALISKSDDR